MADSTVDGATELPAGRQAVIQVPTDIVEAFGRDVQALQHNASVIERQGTPSQIAEAQFALFKIYSSFINSVSSFTYRNVLSKDTRVLSNVSLADIEMLERERQLCLYRMILANNAENTGLGNEFINAVRPEALQKRILDSLRQLASGPGATGSGSGGDQDEGEAEERNPQAVNLENSGGLYSLFDTSDAIDIDKLIGYQRAAKQLVNSCSEVDITFDGRPVQGRSSRDTSFIILSGPPGTGKTTVAQSVAKYMGAVYMYVNAENIVSQWAGVTEKNIAKIFRRGRIASVKYATDPAQPALVIMLIDEIDGLVGSRGTGLSTEANSRITTFLQMLTPPVGVNNGRLILICTTNQYKNLDSAFQSRAKDNIFMGYIVKPEDRLKLMTNLFTPFAKTPLADDQEFRRVAYVCDDLVPRDLQNVVSRFITTIVGRETSRAGGGGTGASTVRINLNDEQVRLDVSEIVETVRTWRPSTTVDQLFAVYEPPFPDICEWLANNDGRARSYSVFKSHGSEC